MQYSPISPIKVFVEKKLHLYLSILTLIKQIKDISDKSSIHKNNEITQQGLLEQSNPLHNSDQLPSSDLSRSQEMPDSVWEEITNVTLLITQPLSPRQLK